MKTLGGDDRPIFYIVCSTKISSCAPSTSIGTLLGTGGELLKVDLVVVATDPVQAMSIAVA